MMIQGSYWQRIVRRLMINIDAQIQRGMEHLDPIIKDRQRCLDEYGEEWEEKPVGPFVSGMKFEVSSA
jgi:hypothetical protein